MLAEEVFDITGHNVIERMAEFSDAASLDPEADTSVVMSDVCHGFC